MVINGDRCISIWSNNWTFVITHVSSINLEWTTINIDGGLTVDVNRIIPALRAVIWFTIRINVQITINVNRCTRIQVKSTRKVLIWREQTIDILCQVNV